MADREDLARLEEAEALEDLLLEVPLPGGLAYRMKRPVASGQAELVLEPLEFLRRLATLVPPPRVNLVSFFGFCAPNASLRKHLVPKQLPHTQAVPPSPVPSPGPTLTPAVALRDHGPTPLHDRCQGRSCSAGPRPVTLLCTARTCVGEVMTLD